METIIGFIKDWGYYVVFLGALIEGESIIIPSGLCAYWGILKLSNVMAVALSGTIIADQSLFLFGHFYGKRILKKLPEERVEKARILLKKYNTLFILSFRFIYGIRTLSPIVIGALGTSMRRFFYLNIIAGVIWTFISCGAGYVIGALLKDTVGPDNLTALKKYLSIQKLFYVVFLLVLIFIVVRFIKRMSKTNQEDKKR